jgi:hypothetical protein
MPVCKQGLDYVLSCGAEEHIDGFACHGRTRGGAARLGAARVEGLVLRAGATASARRR